MIDREKSSFSFFSSSMILPSFLPHRIYDSLQTTTMMLTLFSHLTEDKASWMVMVLPQQTVSVCSIPCWYCSDERRLHKSSDICLLQASSRRASIERTLTQAKHVREPTNERTGGCTPRVSERHDIQHTHGMRGVHMYWLTKSAGSHRRPSILHSHRGPINKTTSETKNTNSQGRQVHEMNRTPIWM